MAPSKNTVASSSARVTRVSVGYQGRTLCSSAKTQRLDYSSSTVSTTKVQGAAPKSLKDTLRSRDVRTVRSDGSISKLSASKNRKSSKGKTPGRTVAASDRVECLNRRQSHSRVYQKGHKKCSPCPPKKHADSSDKDPDYIDESKESTMGSAENQKEEVNLFDDSDDDSKCGKNNNKADDSKFHGMTTKLIDDGATGIEVEQKFDMRKRDPYDANICFSKPLSPLFEEYKFVGSHPQWPPPSIMCCVCLPSGATSLTQMVGYQSLVACYPFCFQKEVCYL